MRQKWYFFLKWSNCVNKVKLQCTAMLDNIPAADFLLAHNWTIFLCLIVGQFGTVQFGTKIIKRTFWHQDNKSGQFGTRTKKIFPNQLFHGFLVFYVPRWRALPKSPDWPLKGILHQKIFYRLNLIFWIVMGCGIARFGRRCLKPTETWKFWS